ncbi:T9SS type A sorting domain-containing protein [Dysgonomonas sp. 520]|uniref:pectate lyase family protein n=1 Tax=Dysgonomonas sp. 520 TaxID=2302931 RepID=UPI0013D52E5E|nr:T9SS type A sorting domain-containing protein [Dysgonomonas sp. 520]NDW09440.1 T9SS C-terminal target domain-containing protein [Dysgonomonas sp. 520]
MKKLFLLSITLFIFSVASIWAQNVNITESAGWLESAYVKWDPVNGADSYNVYYKAVNSQDADYVKIDGFLIRKYSSYFRADVLGLKAGNYQIKVVPVFGETQDDSKQAVSASLEVKAHLREGFAFSANSTFKSGSGAYNDDGSLKSGAQVIYITPTNGASVKGFVTTDKGKEERTGIVAILQGREKGLDKTPLAIRFIGNITASSLGSLSSGSLLEVKGKNYSEMNITFEGVGDDATTNGWGLLINKCGNVEVRNLAFMGFPDDGVSLKESVNLWIHNNDFLYGKNKGGDQSKGDGSLDVKDDCKYTVFSYNHFIDSGKASLCGMKSESGPNYLTYHHNWFDHSDSRHPRVRTMTVHVYNNYYDGVAKYGIGATTGASVFVENNYFRNTKNPMLISKQGTDILEGDGSGTFSGEAGGMIKAFGNYLDAESATNKRYKPYSSSNTTNFDAYVASSRDEQVPSTIKTLSGTNTYNNFDTNSSIMYAYTPDSPEDAKTKVMAYAGRMFGGDFKWSFNNATDDSSYDVNSQLSSALTGYKSGLVSIQGGAGGNSGDDGGDDGGDGGGDGGDGGDGGIVPDGDQVHNFTANDKNSSFYSITGSTTSGSAGGTVTVNGSTLSKYLKMESSTSITFTSDKQGTLTLVFAAASSKKIEINGTAYDIPSDGKLTLELPAGSHKIAKGSKGTTNTFLFYISLTYPTSGIGEVQSTSFTVYPNPVTETLYISSEVEVENVDVYSITGTLVQRIKGNVNAIDMSNLVSGSYIVNVKTAQGAHKQVVIKK